MKRRLFLKNSAKAAAVSLAFPNIILANKKRPKIRVVGTHVTLQETIRQKAEQDLGIDVEFYPGGSAEVLLKASTDPHSFDLYEQWSNSIKVLWQAGVIQPIEIERITYWNEISDLPKKGKISPNAKVGLGDAPYKMLYVQPSGALGSEVASKVSFLPYVHNVDSFGYNAAVIPEGVAYETESWGWLLDQKRHGKVALVNAPTIGLFDAALAMEAKGLINFKDMGNMSIKEIDTLFEILVEYKRNGFFRGVWTSVPHSIELMKSAQVDIESMFSPAVAALNGEGVRCIYAAPKEGYRAWHGVLCMSAACKGEQKEAAYKYLNWWLSGWPGAFIARQGYYISNAQRSRPYMSQAEWDYWYMGKPAPEALRGTDGKLSVKKGMVRRGGSYITRFEHIAIWNTVMDNYEYTLLKWNEFVLS